MKKRKAAAQLATGYGVPFLVALVVLVGLKVSGPDPAYAEANAVTFPPLSQLEHYTTVERGITREHMLTTQAALDAIKAGKPVPMGTHVVLVDYQSNVLTRYLVAQKLGGGIDDWGYQWFWPDETIKADENIGQCYACHQRSRRDQQFMITYDDAVEFEK